MVETSRSSMPCIFCSMTEDRLVAENALAYAIYDKYPVTDGHLLVIPERHADDYFGLTTDEVLACDALVRELQTDIQNNDPTVEGFNIGMNAGKAAGQTVFHCHIHVIPRRIGDVDDPRGGVRHVVPAKGKY